MSTAPSALVDHLVIGAADLDSGVKWLESTFGVVIGAGGRHPLMATHNRLLAISAPGWPDVYLELIAIDPLAAAGPQDGRSRWFGLDDPRVRSAIARQPRLLHLVARTADLRGSLAALAPLGEDPGEPVAASRQSPAGMLEWQISVRHDGMPQHRGALPALIEWRGPLHPARSLPASPVRLRRLRAGSERPAVLARAWAAIGLDAIELAAAGTTPPLEAVFETPRGMVVLAGGIPA